MIFKNISLAAIAVTASLTELMSASQLPEQSYCAGYNRTEAEKFWGSESNAHLSAAVKLTADMLQGTGIAAVKFCIDPAQKMNDCLIFIKDNLDNEYNLYDQEFSPAAGWNTVWLDYPFQLDGIDELYIGYELTCKGDVIGYAEKTNMTGTEPDRVRNGYGEWEYLSKKTGTDVQLALGAILSGGDYSQLPEYGFVFMPDHNPATVKAGTPFEFRGKVINTGTRTVEKLTFHTTVDEIETGEPFTADVGILHHDIVDISVPVSVEQGPHSVAVSLTDGDNNVYRAVCNVEAFERAYPKLPLVEVFTSQYCTNCPDGENTLDKALKSFGEPVARIDHHAGFTADNFTIAASEEVAGIFGVGSAPRMMLNRTPITVYETDYPHFHPAYVTAGDFEPHKRVNTLIGTSTEAVYHTPDRIVNVKITVEKNLLSNYDNVRLHAAVCENNVTDFQLTRGASELNYEHSHAPRLILTPAEGVAVEFDADGRAVMNFCAEIPVAKKGLPAADYQPVAENLEAVVFLSEDGGLMKSPVLNAETAAVEISHESGMERIDANSKGLAVKIGPDGSVTPVFADSVVEIYSIHGVKVATVSGDGKAILAPGIYVARTTSGAVVQKIVVNG